MEDLKELYTGGLFEIAEDFTEDSADWKHIELSDAVDCLRLKLLTCLSGAKDPRRDR